MLDLAFDIQLLLSLLLFAAQLWALGDAASRRNEVFVAAGKLTKPGWLIILGVALLAHMAVPYSPFSILNLAGAVACIVYLVDARPAMRSLTRR